MCGGKKKGVKGKNELPPPVNKIDCSSRRRRRDFAFILNLSRSSRPASRGSSGAIWKGETYFSFACPTTHARKTKRHSQKQNTLDSGSPNPPKNIDGGAPSSLAGAPRVALAMVQLIYVLIQSLPKFF